MTDINDFIEIQSDFDSIGTCNHNIMTNDFIGFNPKTKETLCWECWRKLCIEDSERPIDSLDKNWKELCNEIGENIND